MTTPQLSITLGTFGLEFEGSEAFLRSEVPKFIQAASELQASKVMIPLSILLNMLEESRNTQANITELFEAAKEALKSKLDSLSELGEMESLRLQMAMDRLSRLMSALSDLLKKASDTASGITQNLK
jgi:RNAse (barnase) inhibitor barstar